MAKPTYIMSQSELKALKEEAQLTRQQVKIAEQENYGAGGRGSQFDKSAYLKHAQRMEDLASKHVAPKIRGGDKDKLAKRAAELREKLSAGMCTTDEMRDIRKYPDAPLKHLAWERKNGQMANEYKQLMRRLEPEDPGSSNLERFRR